MKQGMRKILAVLTMLALVLSLGSALAERQPIVSKPFRIPAVQPKATATPEPTVEPTAEPTAEPVRTVSFTFAWEGETVQYGDVITLVPVLEGYDGVAYQLLWQYSTDNVNWVDYAVGDASYVISEENVSWFWRLVVNIEGADAPVEQPAA